MTLSPLLSASLLSPPSSSSWAPYASAPPPPPTAPATVYHSSHPQLAAPWPPPLLLTTEQKASFTGLGSAAVCVQLAADGHILACAMATNVIHVWNTISCEELATIPSGPAMALSADGSRLLSGRWDMLSLWDSHSAAQLLQMKSPQFGSLSTLSMSADGSLAVSAATEVLGRGGGGDSAWGAEAGPGRVVHACD